MPNAVKGKGIWAASGINEENIAMTATETITSNPRVLGADPLVEYDLEKQFHSFHRYHISLIVDLIFQHLHGHYEYKVKQLVDIIG